LSDRTAPSFTAKRTEASMRYLQHLLEVRHHASLRTTSHQGHWRRNSAAVHTWASVPAGHRDPPPFGGQAGSRASRWTGAAGGSLLEEEAATPTSPV